MRFILIFILLFFTGHIGAQRVQVRPGTTFIYDVEDFNSKYQYEVTVVTSSDTMQQLQWKTIGATRYKGSSNNAWIDADNAGVFMVKPELSSEEVLDEYAVRLRPPGWMHQEIEAGADTIVIGIDLADAVLVRRSSGGRIREVTYNDNKINFEYRHYSDVNLGMVLGFMPYGPRNWWLYYFKDENTLIQLVEIRTPPPPPVPIELPVQDSVIIIEEFKQQ